MARGLNTLQADLQVLLHSADSIQRRIESLVAFSAILTKSMSLFNISKPWLMLLILLEN